MDVELKPITAKSYHRFSIRIGRIVVDRTAECGSYWKACESLGISVSAAAKWRKKGLAGIAPYDRFWRLVEGARATFTLNTYPLTDSEVELFKADKEALQRFRERRDIYEAAYEVSRQEQSEDR